MTNRSTTLLTMAAAVAVIGTTLGPKSALRFVWNASESVPTGLYRVQPARRLIVTTLVVAYPPEPLAALLADGGYLPRGVPLIKRILALSGQIVCRTDLTIAVDGIEMGAARHRDRHGRALPVWQGCRTIASDEVFLMNWDEPASLDGRYFGPIPLSSTSAAPCLFGHSRRTDHAAARQSTRLSFAQRRTTSSLPNNVPNKRGRSLQIGLAPAPEKLSARPSDRHVGYPVLDDRKLLAVLIAVQDATFFLSMKRTSWISQLS